MVHRNAPEDPRVCETDAKVFPFLHPQTVPPGIGFIAVTAVVNCYKIHTLEYFTGVENSVILFYVPFEVFYK